MNTQSIGGSLISGASVAKLREAAVGQNLNIDHRLYYDIQRRTEEQEFRKHRNTLIRICVLCIGIYIYMKLSSLRDMYPVAYAWWDSTQRMYPHGQGRFARITLPGAVLRMEFPYVYYLQEFLMITDALPVAGAQFLVYMVSHFGRFMRPMHFNGSAEQLRYTSVASFLPPHAKTDSGINWTYVWESWQSKNTDGALVNPWSGVLFTSVQALAASPAIQAYYADVPDRRFIDALFHGGLAEIAVTFGNDHMNGADMVKRLMGVATSFTIVPCTTSSRIRKGVQTSMEYGGQAGMFSLTLHHFINNPQRATKPSRFAASIPFLITAGALVAGGARGGLKCKNTKESYSGLGGGP